MIFDVKRYLLALNKIQRKARKEAVFYSTISFSDSYYATFPANCTMPGICKGIKNFSISDDVHYLLSSIHIARANHLVLVIYKDASLYSNYPWSSLSQRPALYETVRSL